MRRLRRGVDIPQMQDDLERILNVQDSRDDVPEIGGVDDNRLMIINGTGEIVFRSGGKLYKITATEIT